MFLFKRSEKCVLTFFYIYAIASLSTGFGTSVQDRKGSRATYLHMLQPLHRAYNHSQPLAETHTLHSQMNDQAEMSQNIISTPPTDLRYSLGLEPRLMLKWDIESSLQIITFRLEGEIRRSDLLIFGFSDYGETENADLFVMWTDKTGQHFFQDMHTDKQGQLIVDESQDYILDHIYIRGDFISITFRREYDTCDDHDYLIDSGTTHLLFFLDEGPLSSLDILDLTRMPIGLQRVQLLKSQMSDPPMPPDTFSFTMHVDNVHIPAQGTTYWCQVKKLPPLTTKHHVIKYEGAISPQSEGIVHHMEVFHCDVPSRTKLSDFNDQCRVYGAERPKGLDGCRHVIGAWAMGAVPLALPEEAGIAVGGPDTSSYVMMEIHYNNPTYIEGVVDSSGIKFYVTEKLRPYDAGIMELGLEYTDKYAIPPRQPIFDLKGYCIPECTQVGLPERGIKVFASQLHTHLTGKRVFTKHFRKGIELPELNRDNHYSPHYQEIRKLQRPVTVLPGDYLITTCRDSTIDKENVTMGGFSISDEMCVNYVHYYPKAALEVCKSSATTESLYRFFNFLKSYQDERTNDNLGINDNYHAIRWTPMNTLLLSNFYDVAPLSMQCNRSDGARFPGVEWEGQRIPPVLYPLPPVIRPCLT